MFLLWCERSETESPSITACITSRSAVSARSLFYLPHIMYHFLPQLQFCSNVSVFTRLTTGWGKRQKKSCNLIPRKFSQKNIYLWYPNILSVFKVNYRALGSVTLTLQHCCHRLTAQLIFTGTAILKSMPLNIFSDWCHTYKERSKIITHIFFPLTSVDIGFSCWCVSPGHHWSLYPDLCVSIP